MTEYDIIRSFSKGFTRSAEQKNKLFESDAELIEIAGQIWALNMDEFTPEEDLFTCENPQILGWNLAVATLSDLLAVGASPVWYMHSVSLGKSIDADFLSCLSSGINAVLDKAGCSLCGGDMGCAELWRYCGFAMGMVEGTPLTRIIPDSSRAIWVTGKLGDANMAALTAAPTPQFEFRFSEAKLIRNMASACIDTSGGLFDSLWLLHSLNPGLRMEIDLNAVPYADGIKETVKSAGFAPEAALIGGAGEYELLFTAPENADLSEIATYIGTVNKDSDSGLYINSNGKHLSRITQPPPCPREAESIEDHIRDVMIYAQRLTDGS